MNKLSIQKLAQILHMLAKGNSLHSTIENHAHAVALHFMYYNFGRIHKPLHVTPAMSAGIAAIFGRLKESQDLFRMKH